MKIMFFKVMSLKVILNNISTKKSILSPMNWIT